MATKTRTSLDRVLGRFDSLDPASRANLVQRLARERRLLEKIFNVLKEGVVLADADGRIEYANRTAENLLGLQNENLDEVILWRLVPGLRPPALNAPETDIAQASHAMTREVELTYPEPRVLRLYMVPFRSDEGKAARLQYAVILSDITSEREKTEQRIEDERTASIRLLAAGVAHELGNPLNSLTIHLQLIERRLKKLQGASKADAESLNDSIGICREEVKRLDGIIENFLDALRPRPPELCEINLRDVLMEVLHFQQRELEDRGINVELEDGTLGALPPVMADRNQLKQVFFNLIKNAMEAMRPGGVLKIKANADDDNVYLLLGDTGAGIKQEDLAKLFEPYHTTKEGGHGLGLMIVQRIMREHGGQISLESREGAGTVVTLQFPRKDRRVRMLR